MILEHAILDVSPDRTAEYEKALRQALPLIAETPGFVSLELRPCHERPGRYLLLVRWESLQAHEVGFRKSKRYQRWRVMLHGFYSPFPTVEHYGEVVVSVDKE